MRNSRWYLIERAALLGLTAAALVSCDDGAVEVQAPVPARLVAVTPMEFSGVVGGEVSPGPAVRVDDKNGNPLARAAVVFETPAGENGAFVLTTVESDPNGIARLGTWKLGTQAGTQTMTARLQGLSSVTFRAVAVAGPAARIIPVEGNNQTGPPGYALRVPLLVRVIDSFGNSIAGAEVTFAVQTGAGSITPALATTGVYGQVDALWTLGASGANSVTASAPGLAGVTFTAVAIPLFPATYSLQNIVSRGGWGYTVPSQVFLAADGSFTMYVNDIKGSGTYAMEGTVIRLKYAPGFWELMASEEDTYLDTYMIMGALTSPEETGFIADGKTLTFIRCWTEDCYALSWIYGRVLP